MAIEDDVLALQQTVAQLVTDRDNLVQSDNDKETRLQNLEQVRDDLTPRINTLEQDRRSITRDSLFEPLYLPFYTGGDLVEVGTATTIHIPNDYGALTLRADPAREFDGYEMLLDLGIALTGAGLIFQASDGTVAIPAVVLAAPGVYCIKRINGVWKAAVLAGGFTNT